ncbi:MAG: carboxypeptidase-like regulatory domain-containing protein [Bacteroidales bacterium]|nr:carboxypeptidase-like regulatory domain-containing protein [Bacteroidales bacterium]
MKNPRLFRGGRTILSQLICTAFLLLGLQSAALAQNDTVSVKNVSAEVLVRVMREVSGNSIHIANARADEGFYSISKPRGQFVDEALKTLRESGYSVSETGGLILLSRGKGIQSSLPAGYFMEEGNLLSQNLPEDQNALEVTYQNKVYEIGDPSRPKSGPVIISGIVRDASSGEPIPGISVSDAESGRYAMTDSYGSYRITIPVGRRTISYSGYPMDDITLEVLVYDNGSLDIRMKEKISTLKAAAVSAESVSYHRTATMGIERIQLDRIKKIPAAFGESDLIKAVLSLPGVQSVGEASSGFNVRGGSVDQNLILLNDGTIFNPNHIFGVLSAFNSDIISDAELYKSSIPANLGGRISSVLDIHTKEGNSQKITGALGLGLLTSRFEIEGPLKKDRTTFVLGGRMTYSNWILGFLPPESHYHGGKTRFGDVNASITQKIGNNSSLQVYGYLSGDNFSFDKDTVFHYSNRNAGAKFRSSLSPASTLEISAGYDSYRTSLDGDKSWEWGSYTYSNGISQEYLRASLRHILSPSHTFSWGGGGVLYDVAPGKRVPVGASSRVIPLTLAHQGGIEPYLFVNDSWTVSDKVSLEGGIRLNAFMAMKPSKFYAMPELRLSGKYSPAANFSLKAGINTMRQNIHMITNSSTVSPMDVWTLASERIKPQDGFQVAGGAYWTIGSNIDLSLETYYKRAWRSVDYIPGAILVMNENLPDDLVTTKAKAYGVELMARKSIGKLNGWISYTYSRSLMQEDDPEDPFPINGGKWYSTPHDKPHAVNMALNYKLTHRYSISANLDYSTGRPITVPIGQFYYGGSTRLAYSDRNTYRIPDYFRLDLAVNVEPGHYLRQLTHLSYTIGVYNVTGRHNAYSVYFNGPNAYMISVFAVPIPYINLNLNF